MNRYEFKSHKFGNAVITLKAANYVDALGKLRRKLNEARKMDIDLGIECNYYIANCTILYTKEAV